MDLTPQTQFGGLSIEAMQEAHARVTSGNSAYFKPKPGNSYQVRVLPGAPNQPSIVTVYQHYWERFLGSKKPLSFNCPMKAGTGECPACKTADLLRMSNNPTDVANAKEYDPKSRCFCVVIDRNALSIGPQVWAFPRTVMDDLYSLRTDPLKYGKDFTHPYDGDDLYLKVTKARFTEYEVTIAYNSQKRIAQTDEQIIAWLNAAPNLQVLIQADPTPVILRKIFIAQKEAEGFQPEQAAAMADQVLGAVMTHSAGPAQPAGGAGMLAAMGHNVAPQYGQQTPQQAFMPQQMAPQQPQYQQQAQPVPQYGQPQYAPQVAAQVAQQPQYVPQQQPAYVQPQTQQVAPQQYVAPQQPAQYVPPQQTMPQQAPQQYVPPQQVPQQYVPPQQVQQQPQQYVPPQQVQQVPQQQQQYQMPVGNPMNNIAQQVAQNPAGVQHNF